MRKWIFLLLALLLIFPAAAQDFTASQSIELVPFMVNQLDVQGLRPRTWRDTGNGIYLRARDALDLTAILMQSRTGTASDLLAALVTDFALETTPEVLSNLQTEHFNWSIYQFERQQNNQSLIVNAALAEDEGRVYYVLLQTAEIFQAELHAELFMPAVEALSPVQRYQDPAGRFDVPIPSFWSVEEHESYAVLHDADAQIMMYVSAVEGEDVSAAMQAFWLSIYPDFELVIDPETDIITIADPARIGELELVYIINWQAGDDVEGHVKQGVARIYQGVIYMTLIETTTEMVRQFDEAISMVDNNYRVLALLPGITAEATAAP